jgi:hypothetical protein
MHIISKIALFCTGSTEKKNQPWIVRHTKHW